MSDRNVGTGCATLVLAAGASTRLGQPKQLLKVDGESLLRRTVRIAAETGCGPIFVVLGFDSENMRKELDNQGPKIVINQDWHSGMGSSLRCGINALMEETPLPQNVLILLCDQAKLSERVLLDLLRKNAEVDSLIVASSYAGRLGVPAIFHKQLYPELSKIEGDQGARAVIQLYLNQTTVVDFPEGVVDIDTPQDLAFLRTISRE